MTLETYINTLLEEKGISTETIIEIETVEWGTNFIPLQVVIDYILASGEDNRRTVRSTLVKIDFNNGDVMHFFKHVARHIAI